MRAALKAVGELVLARGGPARLARRLRRGEALVLAYHNVVEDGTPTFGDHSLHLPRSAFARQLDLLQATHEVVPLASLLEGGNPDPDRPRAVLTFDDAYQGMVTVGARELAGRGLPATIFVAPGLIGSRSFWWDALADAAGEGLAPELRQHALDALAGRDAEIRRWAAERGLREIGLPECARPATEAELDWVDRNTGITFGAHTWGHPNLLRLSDYALAEELARPLAWLRARFARVLPWLSYPYGFHSPEVRRAAESAGYHAALSLEGHWIGTLGDRFAVSRLNIPAGLSTHGFATQTAGLR
jgi:peptidoglycan/xylan/chitin deacetylase (PgdA/CDA1 family)